MRIFLDIYTNTQEIMAKEVGKPHNRILILAHTLGNAFLLNLGIVIPLFDALVLALFYWVVLTAITTLAILAIEGATYAAAKSSGGKGSFWQQLHLTNIYLSPVFFVFFIVFGFLSQILPEGLSIGLDVIAFPIVLFMNERKIDAIHKLGNTTLTQIVYGIGVVIAYVVWIVALLLPVLLLSIP